ncbi:MAG: TrkH family potassium uptake protein [Dinoroseobacter sp.]|nr:TrkH family potassium uptake protein [Dinoroseobacter sp.]
MFDLRPVGYVIGLLVAALGVSMLVPMAMDWLSGSDHWRPFLEASTLTTITGGLTALACANAERDRLSIQQTFLLTTGVWLALPVFAALPFVLGATESKYIDAFFEAMSGLTTTGSTVLTDLEQLPDGLLLWRGLMQWFGGIGIIVVAMVFLPELRIGGMQIFRSEGFETLGKILPRATQIASRISVIYLTLTSVCALTYFILGMQPFDAVVHSMTTVATGGFANTDASFSEYSGAIEYAAVVFMLLAALPFVRFVQFMAGSARPLFVDPQVRAFFGTVAGVVVLVAAWKMLAIDTPSEEAFRKSLFNSVSILTGTGYASEDYMLWGPFPVVVLFFAGLIGGCAGSTSCSIKIFRYQLLFASILSQIRRIRTPHGLFAPRFGGRPVSEDVLSSVMAFFVMFTVSLGILSVMLAMTGLDFITSVSGAATALGNIGPGLGDEIGPTGNFAELNDSAKGVLIVAMFIGRLELMVVFAIFTRRFWQG